MTTPFLDVLDLVLYSSLAWLVYVDLCLWLK